MVFKVLFLGIEIEKKFFGICENFCCGVIFKILFFRK